MCLLHIYCISDYGIVAYYTYPSLAICTNMSATANELDESTKKRLSSIPLMKTKAGPRDGDLWIQRLKEEYQALIKVRNVYTDEMFCFFSLSKITSHRIWTGFDSNRIRMALDGLANVGIITIYCDTSLMYVCVNGQYDLCHIICNSG